MLPSRLAILASPSLALAAPLLAQETAEESKAGEIVVLGRGLDETPAAPAYDTIAIGREQIVSAPSGRIEDVLGAVAGFQQFRRSDSRSSNPSAQGVTLRALGGNATSRALVLLDGVPMADPFFGYIPLSAIVPERLGSVRVTRGGGSGPFGAGALAGRIELESADPWALGPLSASLLANDRGGTEASLGLAEDLGAGFVVVDGRWDRGKGFFTTPAEDRVPATARAAFDSWSVGLRGVAPLGETIELQARGLVFRDDRTLRFEGADSSSEGQDASLRVVGRGDWQFEALAYVQARNFSNTVISSSQFTRVLDQRNTPSTGLGGKLELRPPVGDDHVLRLGVDYRRASGELQEEAYSAMSGALTERRRAGGTNTDFGVFLEDDWMLGNLVLTGGLRADRTTVADGFYRAVDANGAPVEETIPPGRADWTLGWRAGATYGLSDALHLRAAAYSGLRQPTLNELYRPFVVFPVVTQANAALENERLEGFEAGFDLTPAEGVALAVTAFDNKVKGAIANVTLAPDLRQRQNLPAIASRGIEGGLSVTRGALRFDGTLAWTDAEVEDGSSSADLDGNRPAQTPRWAAGASLTWTPSPGWLLSASIRHIGAQFEDDRETDVLPAATTLGAYAQMPLTERLSLVLRGENLTDEKVVTRNDGGSIDLGAPRTVWAGLRFGY
ncbi:TonB-dependent receptor plug domain-containing protein [Pelagerythrobacter aerophilus]|uniref:TonB-dependent receptor n=1 Tax=Pelagerythrobacter aerophilus TaxID=2306995 RepID=A0A418NH18_9SPHN|nr:TonB-dependent receptor [Pelagerythrobacter aerophilus]RIV77924.1 TonB-dependent receptor [Pelagerythrobacter aerophilus]